MKYVAGGLQHQTNLAMGKRGPASLSSAGIQRLAEELQTEPSPKMILQGLKALKEGLADKWWGHDVALWFLRAGGLPTLIRHLRASPMSAPTSQPHVAPSAISEAAASAFIALRRHAAIAAECLGGTDVVRTLVDAARDAPFRVSRAAAFHALLELAIDEPAHGSALGEAGLVVLLVTHYIEFGDLPSIPTDFPRLVAQVAHVLLESGVAAAHDLKREILAPDVARTITALVLLLVRHP
jgi:hypothetical protein